MAENMKWALEARHLTYGYGACCVLRNFSLQLPHGSLCALLGTNGCGKSTLLRLLAGAVLPWQGSVGHDGQLGFVPQEVHPALPLSAREMVLLGRARTISILRAPDKADYCAADAALQRVGALHLAERVFSSLSGGERQMVLMARALSSNASVLLLDEPTAALDWHNQARILQLLAELASAGVTVLLSTHSPQHALEFASCALLLLSCDEHIFGPPEQVMDEQTLSRLYRLPVRRITLDTLPDINVAVPVFSSC